jgi:hypothetical protein
MGERLLSNQEWVLEAADNLSRVVDSIIRAVYPLLTSREAKGSSRLFAVQSQGCSCQDTIIWTT